ncbi:MAG: recombinase family protein [Candidatus Cryptobacteroides sp.]
MTTLAYIRVSTEMQTGESQRFEIENYCRTKGLAVSRWVEESISGTVPWEKRRLGKALRKLEKGDIIICTELSRLGRNMLMIMSILNYCSAKGISIHSIKDNFDLTDNINSKIIAFAFALAAEIERTLISQRTKEALAAKKLSGVKLGRPCGSSAKEVTFRKNYKKIGILLENGESISSVARHFGMHRNTLRKYLNRQVSAPAEQKSDFFEKL